MSIPDAPLVLGIETSCDETGLALYQAGRGLLLELYAALRSLKLYPVENATVQKTLYDLEASAEALIQAEGDIEMRLAGDFIFVNKWRYGLRLPVLNTRIVPIGEP